MVSSINSKPNSNAANLNSSNKRRDVFCITRSNTPPSFERQESILNKMAEFVKIFIVITQLFSIFLWRNYRCHAGFNSLENNRVCIVATTCQKIFRPKALNQPCSNCTIRCGTRSDKESHRHTMRIHGQMYLGVEPPFVRPISWFPPLAPAASGCTLT